MTGEGLVKFAQSKIGCNYVYGTKGEILTEDRLNQLYVSYGSTGFPDDYFERSKDFIGSWCCDCSGLISSYTGKILSSSELYSNAKERYSISEIQNAPIGAVLWHSGHVGIYIGKQNGIDYCIEAKGTLYGVCKSRVDKTSFTHWLIMDFIDYEQVDFVKRVYCFEDKFIEFDVINLDGNNYVKVRDFVSLINKNVKYDNNTKVTTLI